MDSVDFKLLKETLLHKNSVSKPPISRLADTDKTCEPVFACGKFKTHFCSRGLPVNHAAADYFISPTHAKRSGNSRRENIRDLPFSIARPDFVRNALTDSLSDASASPAI